MHALSVLTRSDWLILLGLIMPLAVAAAEREPIDFVAFAYLGEAQTRAQYQPLVDYLNATLKHERVILHVVRQDVLEDMVAQGRADIVTTNPTHFLILRKRWPISGVIATLVNRSKDQPLHQLGGVILTRAERQDINTLEDVRGKVIATPSQRHMGGYRAQAYELHLAGVQLPRDAQRIVELDIHQEVVRAVLDGRAEIGFVREGILEKMLAAGELKPGQIKLINAQFHAGFPYRVSTRLYPEWPVFALSHVSEGVVRHIAAALYALEPEHPAAIAAGIYGYTVPADYLIVEELARSLRLPPFDRPPEFTLADAWERWKAQWLLALFALSLIALLGFRLLWMARNARRERQRVERLLATLGEGVYGTDLEGRCTFMNPAALDMLGVREAEVIGRNLHSLFHYQHADGKPYPQHDFPIHQTCMDGMLRRAEEWFWRKDGGGFPVDLVVSPLIDKGERIGTVVAFQDISARRAAEHETQRLQQRNALLLDCAGDGIYGTDLNGLCIFINPAALTMLGFSEAEVLGHDQHLLFHHRYASGAPYPHADCPIHQTLRDGQPREVEDAFIHKDGHVIPVLLKVTAMVEFGEQVGVVVVFRNITAQKAMEAKLVELANTDSLTGLANRRHFLAQLARELARIQRFGEPAALLMLDLDHFKHINDSYGHATGDEVLRAFAGILRDNSRQTDLPGRLGGEEFAVLLPHTDLDAAQALAERIRRGMESLPLAAGGHPFQASVSIGCARLDPHDAHPDVVLARADQALYRAKNGGRNRVELEPCC